MVIVVGSGLGYRSSNPELSSLHFTERQYPWETYESNCSLSSYG